MVSSIYKFMREMGEENIVQKHTERMRERTAERVVTTSFDLRQRQLNQHHHLTRRRRALNTNNNPHPEISAPSNPRQMHTAISSTIRNVTWNPTNPIPKKERVLLLREEKDRFHAMRDIQHRSHKFRKWMALVISIIAFGILWCIGAVVFWQAEKHTQNMTYFQALYFSYVSLLTASYIYPNFYI
jgi:potassium channel subfamily K